MRCGSAEGLAKPSAVAGRTVDRLGAHNALLGEIAETDMRSGTKSDSCSCLGIYLGSRLLAASPENDGSSLEDPGDAASGAHSNLEMDESGAVGRRLRGWRLMVAATLERHGGDLGRPRSKLWPLIMDLRLRRTAWSSCAVTWHAASCAHRRQSEPTEAAERRQLGGISAT